MARLVAVCREGEEDYPFLARQIPLYIDDSLTMVMEFSDSVMDVDSQEINTSHWKQFSQDHSKLKQEDLNSALMVNSREVYSALSQLVPCVGCRRSVEHLFSHLVESGNPALEPLTVKPTGMLSVTKACLADVKKLYTLFYVHGSKLNDMIDAIPKSKKNKRCQLHSLETHKPKPLGGSWMDVWELMSQECRDEVVLIDSACLLETLETYLRKHRFCTTGLCCCPHERHITCAARPTSSLTSSAGLSLSSREATNAEKRHAKTIDVAQEEVLTCLGIHLYERLHRIWQKLRAEEQTWQILFHLGIDALRKHFEMAVEKMQGISRLEQFVEELSEEEREGEDNEKTLDEGSLEAVEDACKVCGSHNEEEETGCDQSVAANGSTSCICPDNTKQDVAPHSNGSDCGYSSSMEGSETGSRVGSDMPALRGICTMTKQEMNQMLTTVLKKRRRMEWTAVVTAGHTQVNAMTRDKNVTVLCQKRSQATVNQHHTLPTKQGIQRQTQVSWNFWIIQKWLQIKRILLKEKFTNYCRATERTKPVCGKWFTTTSVN
ncbi:hypothetical protein KUCAC02_003113 [Chaenocephalus aceratus]|uniref:Uncharacterized protein n=1 Tax=Chaenocephalus aceratus TaxID=36190 RepID=A0ACB9WJK9_CHAAC|nr:hypothetical protein KUCAC02_003113 [Chaenocephalus aceratus]